MAVAETIYIKIACPSCTEHVEFPLEMRGEITNCPHCTLSLKLELPGAQPEPPPPANLYQRLRALNNLPQKSAPIPLPEAFIKTDDRPA